MNIQSIGAYVLGIFILLLCFFGYIQFEYNLGFPDGHMTDYELKIRNVFRIMVLLLLPLSLYVFYLGLVGRTRSILKQLTICTIVLVFLLGIFLLSDANFYNNFDHGQGG